MNTPIDLRNCRAGQKLISKHGVILTYVGPTKEGNYYDHIVKYPDGSLGSRIHDGHVYRNEDKRLPEDHDIVEILPNTMMAGQKSPHGSLPMIDHSAGWPYTDPNIPCDC
jgi:hypothetical protein